MLDTLVSFAAFGFGGTATDDSGAYDDLLLPAQPDKVFSIKSQKGVTMIEYALIAGLISVVAIGFLTSAGQHVTSIFTDISTALGTAAGTGGAD
ncbi:MAG: Flp family type IVb pilin [Chlorobiaceae bacterium]|nr:Flp family type IVb pilin [Chlorobiaceae bacterium]